MKETQRYNLLQLTIFCIAILSLFALTMQEITIQKQAKQIDHLIELNAVNEPQFINQVGFYTQDYFAVAVKDRPFAEVKSTMFHEFAHYVYYTQLSEGDIMLWMDIYNNSTNFVSEYASTSDYEDFAESLAYISDICINLNNLNNLEQDKKYFFIRGGMIENQSNESCECAS